MTETKVCPKWLKVEGCTCRHCAGKCFCSAYGEKPAVIPKEKAEHRYVTKP